ncbi:hypothetical protein ACFE04_001198 [Oxalis oulophora]
MLLKNSGQRKGKEWMVLHGQKLCRLAKKRKKARAMKKHFNPFVSKRAKKSWYKIEDKTIKSEVKNDIAYIDEFKFVELLRKIELLYNTIYFVVAIIKEFYCNLHPEINILGLTHYQKVYVRGIINCSNKKSSLFMLGGTYFLIEGSMMVEENCKVNPIERRESIVWGEGVMVVRR